MLTLSTLSSSTTWQAMSTCWSSEKSLAVQLEPCADPSRVRPDRTGRTAVHQMTSQSRSVKMSQRDFVRVLRRFCLDYHSQTWSNGIALWRWVSEMVGSRTAHWNLTILMFLLWFNCIQFCGLFCFLPLTSFSPFSGRINSGKLKKFFSRFKELSLSTEKRLPE